jgi:hypothetical protein
MDEYFGITQDAESLAVTAEVRELHPKVEAEVLSRAAKPGKAIPADKVWARLGL